MAVAWECCRALGALVLLPWRFLVYLLTRVRQRRRFHDDLTRIAPIDQATPSRSLPDRPLRIFVSCAEASGEAHAINLVEALRAELEAAGAPPPRIRALGGRRLASLDVEVIGDPVAKAAMGLDVWRQLPFYLQLLTKTARSFRDDPPDLFLPVDSPALHVPLGHMARRFGLPVVHYVTPQYWGWAPWRVGSYRRAVDLALTILPFEPAWFARHGVRAVHVGHPHMDVIANEPRQQEREAGPATLVLLAGSRASVVRRNLAWMLVAASRLRLTDPELRVVLVSERTELEGLLREIVGDAGAEEWVRIEIGGLHRELARATLALSVSGTIVLDLLHHRLPAVVVYRLGSEWAARLSPLLLTVPWFTSLNLVAGEEVVPEFSFAGEGPLEEICAALHRSYKDPAWRANHRERLEAIESSLGPAGTARRAAQHALSVLPDRI